MKPEMRNRTLRTLTNGRCVVVALAPIVRDPDPEWRPNTLIVLEELGWPDRAVTATELARYSGWPVQTCWTRMRRLQSEDR